MSANFDTKENKQETEKLHTKSAHKYQSNPFLVSINGLLDLLRVNPVPSLLLALVLAVVIMGAFFISLPFLIFPPVGLVIILALMVCCIPFANGAFHILALKSIKGEKVKMEACLRDAFKRLAPLVGASVLIFLAVLGGLLLFIIPGVIFASWFSLTFFVMFDENLGAIDSMKRSKALAKGHVLEIIGAVIAGSILNGSSSGGGGGILSPVIAMAPLTGWYPQLKELEASDKPKPPVHWMNYVIIVIIAVFMAMMMIFFVASALIGITTNKSDKRYDKFYNQRYDWDNNRTDPNNFDSYFNE